MYCGTWCKNSLFTYSHRIQKCLRHVVAELVLDDTLVDSHVVKGEVGDHEAAIGQDLVLSASLIPDYGMLKFRENIFFP